MRRIFLFIAVITFCGPIWAQEKRSVEAESAFFADYLRQYPKAGLQDVYKLCFQNNFGPGHLIPNPKSAENYLRSEIETTKVFGGPMYEYTGADSAFVRVNVLAVKEGLVSMDLMVECLMRSSETKPAVALDVWPERWRELEDRLPQSMTTGEEAQAFDQALDSLFSQGGYAVHHSPAYNEAYNYHYRLIRADIFEEKILPRLIKK